MAAGAISFAGVHQATPLGTFTSDIETSTTPSVAGAPAGAGDIVVDVLGTSGLSGTLTSVAPQFQFWSASTGGGGGDVNGAGSGRFTAVATSITMSWTMSTSKEWALCAVALKPTSFTRAMVSNFHAFRSAVVGSVVEWETVTERGTLGFHLECFDEARGEYRRVNKRLLPALLHARHGATYRLVDPGANAGGIHSDRLVELEASGRTLTHGPFTVAVSDTPPSDFDAKDLEPTGAGGSSATTDAVFARLAHVAMPKAKARLTQKREACRPTKRAKRERRGAALEIMVGAPGLVTLDAATIAERMGLAEAAVLRLIADNRLALSLKGERVATLAGPAKRRLYFYGEAVGRAASGAEHSFAQDRSDSRYSDENVYWLRVGKGLAMGARNGRNPQPITGLTYTETRHAEGNKYTLTHLFDDPDDDYWMWDFRVGGSQFADCETQPAPMPCNINSFTLPSPGVAADPGRTATLSVRLHGGSVTDAAIDHRVTVTLNDVELGTAEWDGLAPHTASFEANAGLLIDGDNRIGVSAAASGNHNQPSIVYINDFELTYPRRYVSRDNRLEAPAAGHRVISIDGFDGSNIRVFDLHDPKRPRLMTRTTVDGGDANYRVSLRTQGKSGSYLAVGAGAARAPAEVIADVPSRLKRRDHRVDHLIITASDLVPAARALANYRRAQGFRTLVVDIEDIYDEFNYGIRNADAIWSFLRYAHTRWRTGPRFVVLAGEGSHDYKDYLGNGDSIVPTLLTPTPEGLFPSDNLYADVSGNDWVPEMAFGRLPVIDPAELEAVIAKIIAYEAGSGDWEQRVTLSADAPDGGGNFPAASDALTALMPLDYELERIHLDELAPDQAKARMLGGINAGRAFVNFYGHGGFIGLGNSNLLTVLDVPALVNAERLPVVTAYTCLAGQFGFPGQDSVAEALVLKPDGGAIAVWSPTGLSINNRARVLGEGFYRATFCDGERVIGETILKAQKRYAEDGAAKYMLDIYNLIGDPATVMK